MLKIQQVFVHLIMYIFGYQPAISCHILRVRALGFQCLLVTADYIVLDLWSPGVSKGWDPELWAN